MKQIFKNVYTTTNSEIRNYNIKHLLTDTDRVTVYVHSYQADNLMFVISFGAAGKTEVQNKNYETLTDLPYYIQDFLKL